jgi:hypothetical protein
MKHNRNFMFVLFFMILVLALRAFVPSSTAFAKVKCWISGATCYEGAGTLDVTCGDRKSHIEVPNKKAVIKQACDNTGGIWTEWPEGYNAISWCSLSRDRRIKTYKGLNGEVETLTILRGERFEIRDNCPLSK